MAKMTLEKRVCVCVHTRMHAHLYMAWGESGVGHVDAKPLGLQIPPQAWGGLLLGHSNEASHEDVSTCLAFAVYFCHFPESEIREGPNLGEFQHVRNVEMSKQENKNRIF